MKVLIKAILAGIMIGIASSIYLQVGGVVGALLFSIGLLCILCMNFKLYTGSIGFIKWDENEIRDILIILIGNIIGCFFLLLFPNENAIALVNTKLSISLESVFIRAVICGILMYIAVYCFRKGFIYMVPACIAGFILFGAEHCIADLCYFVASHNFKWEMIPFFIICVLGNSIGSIIIDKIQKL